MDGFDADPNGQAGRVGVPVIAFPQWLRCTACGRLASIDAGISGQLYHHLRELLAAGLVVQPARSVYAIPRSNQMALCIQIAVAARVTSESNRYPPPAAEELGEDLPATPPADEEAEPDDGS